MKDEAPVTFVDKIDDAVEHVPFRWIFKFDWCEQGWHPDVCIHGNSCHHSETLQVNRADNDDMARKIAEQHVREYRGLLRWISPAYKTRSATSTPDVTGAEALPPNSSL